MNFSTHAQAITVISFVVPTEPRSIVATNITQSNASLTWQRPDPPNGLITNYIVSYDNVMFELVVHVSCVGVI